MLQTICKDCAKVLLNEDERIKYTELFKRRKDPLQREAIRQQVKELCQKVKVCPHCDSYNGTVKKVTGVALKIVHDKYNHKTPEDVMQDFVKEFEYACQLDNEMGADTDKLK